MMGVEQNWSGMPPALEPAPEDKVNVQVLVHRLQAILVELSASVTRLEQENDRMRRMLNHLGFCPECGETMPCMRCGAGL